MKTAVVLYKSVSMIAGLRLKTLTFTYIKGMPCTNAGHPFLLFINDVSPAFLMNGFYRTGFFTYPAADTFRMVWAFCRIHLHLTYSRAGPAVHASLPIHPITEHCDRIENRINRSQRTYVLAERPVNQNRQDYNSQQQCIFPYIQPP